MPDAGCTEITSRNNVQIYHYAFPLLYLTPGASAVCRDLEASGECPAPRPPLHVASTIAGKAGSPACISATTLQGAAQARHKQGPRRLVLAVRPHSLSCKPHFPALRRCHLIEELTWEQGSERQTSGRKTLSSKELTGAKF